MSASKAKGTAAEAAVVRYLQSTYWPYAERRALHGGQDKGDITGTPGLCWEVKSAKTLCVPAWLRETEAERVNSGSKYATLVIKPPGVGALRAGQWHALMEVNLFNEMIQGWPSAPLVIEASIRKMKLDMAASILLAHTGPGWVYYRGFVYTSLAQMCRLLYSAGYGSSV